MENSDDHEGNPATDRRKPQTVRLRKRVTVYTDTDTSKKLRTMRLMKTVVVDPVIAGPTPGSIEEDFLFEREKDPRAFLKSARKESPEAAGPRFDGGKLVPYSVIGPADMFERQHTAELKSREEKAVVGARRATFLLRKTNKTPPENPEQRFQSKLQRIHEGRNRDIEVESKRLQALPPGIRIIEARQHKCLQEFERTKKDWQSLGSGLAARAGRPLDQLVGEQYQLHREKQEELDLFSKPLQETGVAGWYMSLRSGTHKQKIRSGHVAVGNLFSGIYAQLMDRTQSADVLIRRGPSDLMLTFEESGTKSTRKTFRDYPYFQQRAKEGKRLAVTPRDVGVLMVQGLSKFEAEMQALRVIGLEAFKPELMKLDHSEEVVAEHYDARYRY